MLEVTPNLRICLSSSSLDFEFQSNRSVIYRYKWPTTKTVGAMGQSGRSRGKIVLTIAAEDSPG